MDILFILLGVAIFFASAAVFALEHYEVNPAQALVSFLVPPFAWWLYFNHWERSRMIALTQFIAVLLIIGGALMNLLLVTEKVEFSSVEEKKARQIDSSGYVGSDDALRDLAFAERRSQDLNGRLKGKDYVFNPAEDVAEFDFSGTLRLKSGKDFFGNFEIAIELGKVPEMRPEPLSYTIRPDTANPPVIFISWLDETTQALKSIKYDSEYFLDLKLTHEEYNFFSGHMQLVLPDPEKSYLVGNFPVYSSRLRFHGEGIIRDHDSIETLEVIANQSLKTTYKKEVDKVFGFQATTIDFRTGDGIGRSTVVLTNKSGLLKSVPLIFYKNEGGWYLDVKGLKERIKSDEAVLSSLPGNLSKALEVDFRNIGDVHLTETSKEEIPDAVVEDTELKLAESSITEPEVSATAENDGPEPGKPVISTQETPEAKQASASIRIDIATQEDQIQELLLGLMNSEVELQTTEGKFKNGVYVGVHRKQVVLETELGGGVVEFLTEYAKLKSIRVLNTSRPYPHRIEFFSSAEP